jgi:3-hydroxy-9,10-secoandrosta-1,3,5(10)-triene-9,17-dione monooxygenase
VSGHTDVRAQEIPVPEPDLTPEAVIARGSSRGSRSRSWMTYFPPQVPRYTHPDYQRSYGQALALTDAAEAIVLQAGEQCMELTERWDRAGEPFTREQDVRLFAMLQQAGQLAARAVEIVFATAGSSAAKRGTRLQRYYRDVAMYQGHIAAQHLATAGELARVHFGLPDTLF